MEQASKGTSTVYRQLTSKEKETLAMLDGTPVMEVLIKAIQLYQQDKAKISMALAMDFNSILVNRGEIQGSRWIIDLVDYTVAKKETAIQAKAAIAELEKSK